jgi:hypothetical protein
MYTNEDGRNPEFYKNITKTILPFYGIKNGLFDDQYELLSKLTGTCEAFKSLTSANIDGDVIEISPTALLGFIDSILSQANAIYVVHDAILDQISTTKRK